MCAMYETSKTAQVINEFKMYQVDILGVSECRWSGSGCKVPQHDVLLIIGDLNAKVGSDNNGIEEAVG